MVKMIDIKLREQFRFSFQSFSDMPEPDLQEFAKQCRIVYVVRKNHASKGIMVGVPSIIHCSIPNYL